MVRLAHGPEGIRATDCAGDIGIRAGLAIRNTQQRLPAIFLELGSSQIEFNRESAQFTTKVAFELGDVRPQMFR